MPGVDTASSEYVPMQKQTNKQTNRLSLKDIFGSSIVALASSIRCTADHGHGERQVQILPGLTFTLVRWEAVRIPLVSFIWQKHRNPGF